MKKCFCYFDESCNSVYAKNDISSLFIGAATIADMEVAEQSDININSLPVITEELIMLKKAGFTAQEIIELKQSKLI